ncbi:TldD/PmbA family protein [Granulicella tundricola]|uniref:Peptidase U62 modulator of DNA gyrase n=1 Tax=Granulicella tundricola (strain ATCC BAA-1859 / DSM 23138 / MP5ACTX9) TaxID=1198114 RepID=E8X2T3_GRATM|nr:TldD/PmbA family protein [Granulicella tundricola]ADW70380.1 peptidase U62 modulator of DNA gyrase [Granulicella tundricola MP5ACTX9]
MPAVVHALDLRTLAQSVLDRALKAGATDAEAVAYEGEEFSALVRLGQVETLKESGSRAIGLRVFNGLRSASTSSSDLSPDGLAKLVEGAVALAKITSEDPFSGLPEASAFGQIETDQHLYYEDVNDQPPEERIEIARRCEAAAMAFDTRIQNSGGGDFDTATSHKIMVNSRGFIGETRRSYCGFSAAPIAHDEHGHMQRNYWFSSSRTTRLLEDPEAIGRKAAERTLRRLGARRVKTQRAPVVFSPEIAKSIIGNIFEAANGDAIYRHASFLDDMLGQQIAGPNINVIDDGTMVHKRIDPLTGDTILIGGFGTSPFDGEGLPTRRTVLVENGILKNYVLNTYTARKLGMASTGNASRGLAGNPGIGAGNFYLEPGTQTPEEIIAGIPSGLYVTETMGFGVNLVTGDYSQGAAGLWIENGELAYPVEEITIAGNLKDMYKNIVAIGNDLTFRGAAAAPTLHIEGMMIAGA